MSSSSSEAGQPGPAGSHKLSPLEESNQERREARTHPSRGGGSMGKCMQGKRHVQREQSYPRTCFAVLQLPKQDSTAPCTSEAARATREKASISASKQLQNPSHLNQLQGNHMSEAAHAPHSHHTLYIVPKQSRSKMRRRTSATQGCRR